MRNIKLVLEYDGSRYAGWQKSDKSNKDTDILTKVKEVLEKMEDKPTELIGAIRTEAGVHAYKQVANFKTVSVKKTLEIKNYLNRYLPRDIAVLSVSEADERFHAAFNAKSFVFEYHITMGEVPSVFERKYNYYCFKKPDVSLMKEAAGKLIGTHDLKAFSDNKRMKKSTERTIDSIDIYSDEKEMQITIKADDFWPNMARIIVATLIAAGHGELTPSDVEKIVATGDREKAPLAIDPKGLFLADVIY